VAARTKVEADRANDAGACLSEDAALAYVRGAADAASDQAVQQHLDHCAPCRVMIGEAARMMVGDTEAMVGTPGAPVGPLLTLAVGDVVAERYEILAFVARGGMGEVYRARDRVLGETVALKTLVCTALDNPHAISRLLAEVRLARHVSHPNVCRIFELGFHRGPARGGAAPETVPFLTMEFLAGDTLDRRIAEQRRLEPEHVAELLAQLCAGLGAIHAAGIVHRDIKPHNVMLLPGTPERLVLTDFGLARALETDGQGGSITGAVAVGTLDYMAPEQLEGKPATPGFDVYALGIMLYEMLTGQKPFQGETALAGALARLQASAPAPSQRVPGLHPGWDALVARCLERDPAARFERVEDIVAPVPGMAFMPAARPTRRRRWIINGIVLAVVVAAALAEVPLLLRTPSERHAPAPAEGASGCASDMVRVADRFCIDRLHAASVDERGQPRTCASAGKRSCTASELETASQAGVDAPHQHTGWRCCAGLRPPG